MSMSDASLRFLKRTKTSEIKLNKRKREKWELKARLHKPDDDRFTWHIGDFEICTPLAPELTDGQQSIIASFASELPVKDRAEFRGKVQKALAEGQINDQRLVRTCLDVLKIP